MADRVLPLRTIHNFRDYGDYPISGGGRLAGGMLYRSAQHCGASPEDLDRVVALNLAAVVDLRSPAERQAAPCPRGAGFAAEVFRITDDAAGAAPHLDAPVDVRTADDARSAMLASYRAMPFSRSMVQALRTYFQSMASASGPHLIHCMAGKDRTGLAVAMMHKVLGVHADDAMQDYLLTNSAGDPEARIVAGAASVRAVFGDLSDAGLRVLMGVHPDFLLASFAAIDAKHGSFDRYAREVLAVDEDQHRKLVDRLVA